MSYTTIKVGNNFNHGTRHKEHLVTGRDDIPTLPTTDAPGSMAYPADRSFLFVLSNEATWIESLIPWDWGTI